jgi:hypothetical protein
MMTTLTLCLFGLAGAPPARAPAHAAEPVFATEGRSADGKYRFAVDDGQVSVWRRAGTKRVGHVTFDMKNAEGRFVTGNNILVTSSCGSPCWVGTLFTPTGSMLTSMMYPMSSSDGRYALDLDVLNLSPGDTVVTVVDLKTGRKVGEPKTYPGLFGCTENWSSPKAFEFRGCPDGQSITVPFQP